MLAHGILLTEVARVCRSNVQLGLSTAIAPFAHLSSVLVALDPKGSSVDPTLLPTDARNLLDRPQPVIGPAQRTSRAVIFWHNGMSIG